MTKDHTSPTLPRVGLGCMGMSEFYGATDAAEAHNVLDVAFELGYRHFDTADMYGSGHNEELLGRFLGQKKKQRPTLQLASKVGLVRSESDKYSLSVDGSPTHIKRACDASLQRLRTDYIDLYYLHRADPRLPIEESVGALAELVVAGKVRSLGLCEVSTALLRRAHAVHPIAAVQSEYSLWTRDVEKDVMQTCRELAIEFVAFSPLGRGFLTGTVGKEQIRNADPGLDLRTRLPRFSSENIDTNLLLLRQLEQAAAETNASMSQVALAWVLSKGEKVHVIPGTKQVRYLQENFAAREVSLSLRVIQELEQVFTSAAVQGLRYPQSALPLPS
jgi:aryl-alcohol dehydrogenase-like predicted oxidoreductase